VEFWASAEIHQPAFLAMNRVRLIVEPFLNAAFASSSLATLEGKLRYVPIIMPEDIRERYPTRSKLLKKELVYDCAPQLDYDIFAEGTFEDQLEEYLKGIASSAPHLVGLGAAEQQIKDFETILAGAAERILAEQLARTRH
jgi:hypothetical protein